MRRFIHRANIKHYQELLARTTDQAERQRILKLLAEEESQHATNIKSDLARFDGPLKRLPTTKH